MAEKVMTAPLAKIVKNGVTIGKMKNVRVTETIRRGRVSGIGELTPQELPALEWNGTLNAQFYTIDLKKATNSLDKIGRDGFDVQNYIDNVLLQEEGVDIVFYKKIPDTVDQTTGLVTATKEDEFAQIKGCFIDREGFDITEGQISGKDQDFTYTTPILFAP